MFLSDDVIEEVRSRSDIVDVISSYVKLQKKGSSYFGCCPFHNEKTPSFSVSPHKQMFYCFGCGEGGNVFSFLMKYDSLTFIEAVKQLADRAGIELPEIAFNPEEKKKADLKTELLEINKEAAKYYHYLLSQDTGDNARAYFTKRELKDETIKAFGLGVSSMRSDSLYKYMKNKGYKDTSLKETGLFVYDDRGVHDRFRNRVMFPILNINNKVIGFGGRVMGEGQPKYLNSPETPVFDKGRNLYGLHAAKNARQNHFIVCEGYMDVISMHQAGFTQAVASLGTALTLGQAMLIKRYVKDVLLCYDSDGAGVKATLRAIGIFKEAGISTRIISLEPYKDADEFIKAEGADAFKARIDSAENSFLFEIRILERNYNLSDPTAKTEFFNEVAKKLAQFSEEIERNNYLEAVATRYFVSAESLKSLVRKHAAAGINRPVQRTTTQVVREKDDGIRKAQGMLLTWIADDVRIYNKIKEYIQPKDFTDDVYRKVAQVMFDQIENGNFNPATILNNFNGDEYHSEVAKILNTDILKENADNRDRERAINEIVKTIKDNSLKQMMNSPDMNVMNNYITELKLLNNMHISLN